MGEVLASGRGLVTRVVRDDGLTVIVKERDDEALGGFAATNLETERRALTLLAPYDVAPELLEATPTCLVMSDVGRSVEEILFRDDAEAAVYALRGMARAAARLHTVPLSDAFDGLSTWTVTNRERRLDQLERGLADLGFPPLTDEVRAEHDAMLDDLRGSNTLIHGDLVPNNAAVDEHGEVRLVDLEGCAYDHVGHDLAMLAIPFAWFGKWRSMPSAVVDEMLDAYGPMSARDVAIGVMAMAFLRLERLPVIAAEPTFRRTNQIAWTLDRAVELIDCPATSAWFAELSVATKKRWPDAAASSPVYPAFES